MPRSSFERTYDLTSVLSRDKSRAYEHAHRLTPSTSADAAATDEELHKWDSPEYAYQVQGRRLGEFSAATIKAAMDIVGHVCERCGHSGDLKAHHILPLGIAKKYFSHIAPVILAHFANCQILCHDCHVAVHKEAHDLGYYHMVCQGLLYAVSGSIEVMIATDRLRTISPVIHT